MTVRTAESFNRIPDFKIVYDGEVTSWKKVLNIHPLRSPRNEAVFRAISDCTEIWGKKENGSGIRILRSAYTWKHLTKTAQNSLEDCQTFYEVAKHTMFGTSNEINKEMDRWFKVALTALYIGNFNAPESLNYISQLTQESVEKSVSLAFQHFGLPALTRYSQLKNKIKIENFNEKAILWYWDVDGRENNLIVDVLDKLYKKDRITFDLEYIGNNVKPKNLIKYQTLTINDKFIPLKEILVSTDRYKCEEAGRVCLLNETKEKISLDSIFNLFVMQSLFKTLEPKNVSSPSSMRHIDGKYYRSFRDMYEVHPLSKDAQESMIKFLEINLKIAKEKKSKECQNFWEKSLREVSATILNDNLEVHEINNRKIKI